MTSMRRDQLPAAAILGFGFVVLVVLAVRSGGDVFSLGALALYSVIVWWSWPGRRGKHTPHAEALAAAGDDDVIIYWRPG
ncbi:MAG: hypothetical protein AAF962_13580 [Actinomycetota bacterium]